MTTCEILHIFWTIHHFISLNFRFWQNLNIQNWKIPFSLTAAVVDNNLSRKVKLIQSFCYYDSVNHISLISQTVFLYDLANQKYQMIFRMKIFGCWSIKKFIFDLMSGLPKSLPFRKCLFFKFIIKQEKKCLKWYKCENISKA